MNSTHTSTDAYRRLSRRHFTKDFKRSVVEHLLSNELTVAEVHVNTICIPINRKLTLKRHKPKLEISVIIIFDASSGWG